MMDRRSTLRSSTRRDAITTPELLREIDTKTQVSKSCRIMELPSELILESLSRLPLKSILRCKVVCKQWYKLLTDPYFSSIYSQNSPFTTFLFSPLRKDLPSDKLELYLLEISRNGEYSAKPFKPRLPLRYSSRPKLQGSCKGLFCVASDKSKGRNPITELDCIAFERCTKKVVRIWNPIMGSDCITLPQHKFDKKARESSPFYVFGNSYGVNKFKVLKLSVTSRAEVEGLIFNVGVDDGWRILPDLFDIFDFVWVHLGIFFKGVYHWTPEYKEYIRTFDLGKEKQGLISWPWCCPKKQKIYRNDKLRVLNDQLCLIEYFPGYHTLDIWTMKEYGVAESWTKAYTIESWIPSEVHIASLIPVAILENGDIVLFLIGPKARLVFYDPKLKEVTKVTVLRPDKFIYNLMSSYVPSFSPLSEVINGVL